MYLSKYKHRLLKECRFYTCIFVVSKVSLVAKVSIARDQELEKNVLNKLMHDLKKVTRNPTEKNLPNQTQFVTCYIESKASFIN